MGVESTETELIVDRVQEKENTTEYQKFIKLRTAIHPEGDEARVTITTTTGLFKLNVPFEYIAHANTEIRRAAILMLYRQTMKKDAGQNAYDELLKTALRPDEVSVIIDSATGDRYWVFQFDDHGSVVIRMSPEMELSATIELAMALKQTPN